MRTLGSQDLDQRFVPLDPHDASVRVRDRIAPLLEAIHRRDATLHAFVDLDDVAALRRADELDGLPGAARGPLHGLPVAVKEVIDVAGRLCGWGSALHRGRRPAQDALIVRRLLHAGAVVMGITASTEYALAAPAATVHPLDAAYSPGASSSGSAAAVAAGLVPVGLGTQTIGSIIRPAAYCGVVGFKPSHGRYPGDGLLCLSERLDAPGVIAADVAHVQRIDRVVAAVAAIASDPVRAPVAPSGWCWLDPWFDEPLSPVVHDTIGRLRERLPLSLTTGRTVRTIEIDGWIGRQEADVTDVLLTSELARRHPQLLDDRDDRVSAELRAMAERGARCSGDRIAWAVERQRAIAERLDALLRPGEVGLTAATLGTAPKLSEGSGSRAPQRLWTLAGMPVLALPLGQPAGWPVAIQLVARRGEDAVLLEAAQRLETGLRVG